LDDLRGGGVWSSVGTLLGQMRAAGCTEWALAGAVQIDPWLYKVTHTA
jgi:hypothetical protein